MIASKMSRIMRLVYRERLWTAVRISRGRCMSETGTQRRTKGWCWSAQHLDSALRFVGKGPPSQSREAALGTLLPVGVKGAWLKQVHGAEVVAARDEGCLGAGDALVTAKRGLALVIVTADCVPVLLAGQEMIGAAHAGWRGIVRGVVRAAVEEMGGGEGITAWIGPSIGPCCYEVSDQVAADVARVSAPQVVMSGAGMRPHLDLVQAVRCQLTTLGVDGVHIVPRCTRCATDLCSYRRDGPRRGRNLSLVWRL